MKRTIILGLIAISVMLIAWTGTACADTFNGDTVPGEVIVGFEKVTGIQAQEFTLIKSYGGDVIDKDAVLNWVLVKVEEGKEQEFIANISKEGNVRYAEPNGIVRALYVPNDLRWGEQWGPERISADDAWDIEKGAGNVKLAIVDSGVDYTHKDLSANYVSGGYDWIDGDNDPMDDYGHGTHCAGIAAAVMDNGKGIAGIAQVEIMAEKVLNETGYGSYTALAHGITHAANENAEVISMSVGGGSASSTLEDACQYAWDLGYILVAAAGNDNSEDVCYPARYNTVIAVGAINEAGGRSSYSNYGPDVELAAPGDNILSTTLMNGYNYASGTSMATPHVAGVAALVWSLRPELTKEEVRERLHLVSTDYDWTAYGLVDAMNALSAESEYVKVSSINVVTGKVAKTQVSIGNAENITGVSLNLSYNSSVVEIKDIAANATINASGNCICDSILEDGLARIIFLSEDTITTTSENAIIDVELKAIGIADSLSYLSMSSVEFTNTSYLPYTPSEVYNGTVNVLLSDYGVNLEVEGKKYAWNTTEPNVNASYLLAVSNTGVVTDSYTLGVENPDGADVATLNVTEISNLASGATANVLLHVTDAIEGTYIVNVTATSGGDPEISDKVMTKTRVAEIYNLQTNLLEGWNMFAVPLNVSTRSLPAVLESIENKYDYICYYNATTREMDYYDPLNPEFSTLNVLEPGAGYLIHLTENATVYFVGVKLVGLEIPLECDWNMFSVPYGVVNKTLPVVLESIEGKYEYVSYYNATTGEMDYYDPLNPEGSTLKVLEPGAGYLILMTEKVIYIPDVS